MVVVIVRAFFNPNEYTVMEDGRKTDWLNGKEALDAYLDALRELGVEVRTTQTGYAAKL